MKFCIISHAIHTQQNGQYFSYSPYVREMNLWLEDDEELIIVAPLDKESTPTAIESSYKYRKITFISIPVFNVANIKDIFRTMLMFPVLGVQISRAMYVANHIHLRCPGNVGLIGCLVQIFFPRKMKTAKYAGNWDKKSKQPWSYQLQQFILSNTFFTRNIKVLLYGHWPKMSKNLMPFYTASYTEQDKNAPLSYITLNGTIKILYVGAFIKSKCPMTTILVCEQLNKEGIKVNLDLYGDGIERLPCQQYVAKNNLGTFITFHGNQSEAIVKQAYQQSNFLVFISRSEGWPKVVAEAMFWGCVPITTAVSCVPEMIAQNDRGKLVNNNLEEIVNAIKYYICHPDEYERTAINAMQWSRQYTLEKLQQDLKQIVYGSH